MSGGLQFTAIPGVARPHLRDITSVTSWIGCFLLYTAVQTTDLNTWGNISYARLLIQEALRHGGTGWLDYDRVFHKQAPVNPLEFPGTRLAHIGNPGHMQQHRTILLLM